MFLFSLSFNFPFSWFTMQGPPEQCRIWLMKTGILILKLILPKMLLEFTVSYEMSVGFLKCPLSGGGCCHYFSHHEESESESCSVVSDLQPCGPYSSWNSPDQNTGMGSCSLLQGKFPTWRLNPDLPYCRTTR